MDWGALIKNKRKEIGVTQEQLADVSGVSLSYIKLIESNKVNPTISMIENLMDCLGLEIKVAQKESRL